MHKCQALLLATNKQLSTIIAKKTNKMLCFMYKSFIKYATAVILSKSSEVHFKALILSHQQDIFYAFFF